MIFGSELSGDQNGITLIQCYDTESESQYRIDDVVGAPQNLCAFQTLEETFFLLSNGSLWRLVEVESSGKLKATHINMLWTHKRCLLHAWIQRNCLYIAHRTPRNVQLTWPAPDELPDVGGAFKAVNDQQCYSDSQVDMLILPTVIPRASLPPEHSRLNIPIR